MRLYQKTVIIIFLVSFILVVSGCKQNTVEKTVSTTPSEVETGNLLEEELQKQDEDRAALISFWEQNREDMEKTAKVLLSAVEKDRDAIVEYHLPDKKLETRFHGEDQHTVQLQATLDSFSELEGTDVIKTLWVDSTLRIVPEPACAFSGEWVSYEDCSFFCSLFYCEGSIPQEAEAKGIEKLNEHWFYFVDEYMHDVIFVEE